VETLQDRIAALESAMQQTQSERQTAERRANRWRGLAAVLALLVVVGLAPQAGHAQVSVEQMTLEQRVAALEAKLKYLTTTGTSMVISGANLSIVNGLGRTDTTNGLGNLIIGYNEMRNDGSDNRTGSHNLVLGSLNNYSSYGGLVAGYSNEISGPYATVSGGEFNLAQGTFASVSGGTRNEATGAYASVSGGSLNIASGGAASVSGGWQNSATDLYASVSGGGGNTASGFAASVSGGLSNTASGDYASVSGGRSNTAGAEPPR